MSSSGKDPRRSRMDGDRKATLGTLLELQRCKTLSQESGTCRYLSFPQNTAFFVTIFETSLFHLDFRSTVNFLLLRVCQFIQNSMFIHASPDGLWLRAGTALSSSQMRQRRCPGPCPARSAVHQMTRIRLVASQRWSNTGLP